MKSNSINVDDLNDEEIKDLKSKLANREKALKNDVSELVSILDKLDKEAQILSKEEFEINLRLKLKPNLITPNCSTYGWNSERISSFDVEVIDGDRKTKKLIKENYDNMCLEVLPAINATKRFKKLRTLQNELDKVFRAAHTNDRHGKYQVYTEFINNRYANERCDD